MTLPQHCDVAIIGGGVAGCSVAYHLAKLGITDVVLLERMRLTSGTTWHAAGLVTQLRASAVMTNLAKYTGELYTELEAETGQATGYRRNGTLRIALTEGRMEELKRGASMAGRFDLPVEVLSPGAAGERYPGLKVDDLVGAVFLPRDGQVNPADVTMALAAGARMRGVKIRERTAVTKILVENGRAVGVRTAEGDLRADKVVICGGMWSRELAGDIGVSLPLHAAEHFYVVTEPVPGLPKDLPILISGDECTYCKEDAGKILLGCFEPVAKPWGMDGIPADFEFGTLPEDLDHIAPILEAGIARVPMLEGVGIRTFFNGPESFTPDDKYLLGETPEVQGLFCACGFNSIGIGSSGGAGKALAEWIRDGRPPMELADVDVRRMSPFQSNRSYLRDRTVETLGYLYQVHWPGKQMTTARGALRSPFHDRLLAAGAAMAEVQGWERPGFFAADPARRVMAYSFRRPGWFDLVGEECRRTETAASLFDYSCFSKFRVEGRDACAALDRICANAVDVPVGKLVYTQWLNPRGGIEADVTVIRLGETSFLVVTPAAGRARDFDWLTRNLGDGHVFATDVTSGLPTLALMGPRARDILRAAAPHADLSNDAFPFGTAREIELGYARVLAARVSYVGELGWELYMPAESALHALERLEAAGAPHGLGHAGYFALNALRMEKGYRHWGHDIGEADSPLNAGLGFAVAWDKPGGFIGREALLADKAAGAPSRRLVQIRLEDRGEATPMMFHEEPILKDGRIVGHVTSGAWGHRIGASLGMGYVTAEAGVTADWLASGGFEVEIACERVPARAQLAPFLDPANARMRA